MNVRSICNKISDLESFLADSDISILALCETWLDNSFTDAIITPPGFCIKRKDRCAQRGGGVAVLVSENITCVDVNISSEFNPLEAIAVDIFIPYKIRLVCVYRPPGGDYDYASLLAAYINIMSDVSHPICVVGDFNLPYVNWSTLGYPSSLTYDAILPSIFQSGLIQLVDFPTRGANMLDLFFTNSCLNIAALYCGPALGTSDHKSICFELVGTCPKIKRHSEPQFDFEKADINNIADYLSRVNWLSLFASVFNIDNLWCLFCNVLSQCFSLFVPLKIRRNSGPGLVYPPHIKRLLSQKLRLWKSGRITRDFADYNRIRKKCANEIDKFRRNRENKILRSNNRNLLYKFVNNRSSVRGGVAPLKDYENNILTDDAEKAELFAKTFHKVFTVDNGTLPNLDSIPSTTRRFDWVAFTPQCVCDALCTISRKPSNTPDGFSQLLLYRLRHVICIPLAYIFEHSFVNAILPTAWREATVVPIYKKGDSSNPSNYRPISLLSGCSKVMEKIVNDNLVSYLIANKLVSDNQHGFLKRRSTVTQLLDCFHSIALSLDARNAVDITYFDLAKAFDTVSHPKLIHKLQLFGITGQASKWLQAFLARRYFKVKVSHDMSGLYPVTSGVPQGSVLGPTLFLLYINDLCYSIDHVDCIEHKLFADDLKVYAELPKNNPDLICDAKQLILDTVHNWCETWQLRISVPKCLTLHLGGQNPLQDYHCGGANIPSSENCRDLGIVVDSKFNFHAHVTYVCNKTYRVINMLFRCFSVNCIDTLVFAYKCYARPLLEYGSPVWNPTYLGDIDHLEKVQRYFTRRVFYRARAPMEAYELRLERLHLESLEARRLVTDLTMVFKIINKEVDLACETFFDVFETTVTRGHRFKLKMRRACTNNLKHSFCNRVVLPWNSLPETHDDKPIIAAPTSKIFRNNLRQYNLLRFLKYNRI